MTTLFGFPKVPDLPRALCVKHPSSLFFLEGHPGRDPYKEGRAICARCPEKEACLEWAMTEHEPAGLWGGLSPEEREALKKRRQRDARKRRRAQEARRT
jgi:WhiB family redox-sensing transcriptional regulator